LMIISIVLLFIAVIGTLFFVPSPFRDIMESEYCTSTMSTEMTNCSVFNLNQTSEAVYEAYYKGITRYNRFLFVSANPIPKQEFDDRYSKFVLNYRVILNKLNTNGQSIELPYDHTSNHTISCYRNSDGEAECDEFTVIAEPELEEGDYKLSLKLLNYDDTSSHIGQLEFWAITVDEGFTLFHIVFRYIAVITSIICAVSMCINLGRIKEPSKTVFEQRYVLVLSFLLILFNDPLAGINLLSPNPFRYQKQCYP